MMAAEFTLRGFLVSGDFTFQIENFSLPVHEGPEALIGVYYEETPAFSPLTTEMRPGH